VRARPLAVGFALLLAGLSLGSRCGFHEPAGHASFASPQVAPLALSGDGLTLYVANTTSHSVSVIHTGIGRVIEEIAVGLEPVSLALRPDGRELFVANHVSDSISVIDTRRGSPTRHRVVATLQELDARGATLFDEPVGIAFASDVKAYVALSSRNEIAVLERSPEGGWQVRPGHIAIGAQEPRALAVRDGRLYVLAFESSNQTEVSNCPRGNDPPQCTFGPLDPPRGFFDPAPVHIVRDPDVPDRDLFVFDTADESPLAVVRHIGTLLYGLAPGPGGRVFVTLTEARNDVNGLQGGSLADLDNRIYLNRVAAIDCAGSDCRFDPDNDLFELEPLPPARPAEGRQLATPYAIAVSEDGATLFGTAAASSRLFTVDAQSGSILDVLDVGAIPRGIALRSDPRRGTPRTAWVLNALGNSVSAVDVSRPEALRLLAEIPVGSNPTPEAVHRGRIAFESAHASTSGTFSCASCHPDAHVDQLLWRIGGRCSTSPFCADVPRSTQPIRGLRHSVPLHWDGTLGDPFGGPNGAVGVGGDGGIDCALGDADDDHDCFLDLVRTSLAGVMCDQAGACPPGGERLSAAEQDDMAHFLASVWHPPARSRALDDRVSPSALDGFADFFVDQGGIDRGSCAETAAGCHVLPLGTGTNGSNPGLFAFDAPSLRGLTDRHLQGSLGGNTSEDILRFMNHPEGLAPPFHQTPPSEFPYDPARGIDERSPFAVGFMFFRLVLGVGPVDIFQMFEEAGTGTSGATGRQITLDAHSLGDASEEGTLSLLSALEAADRRGAVQLAGEAIFLGPGPRRPTHAVTYLAERDAWLVGMEEQTREWLLEAARSGERSITLTARLPVRFGEGVHRQPLLAVDRIGVGMTGDPALPFLPDENPMILRGIDIEAGAALFVDGAPASGTLTCVGGEFAPKYCVSQRLQVRLDVPPHTPGLHLLQVQNPDGPQSNELPICVAPLARCL
jgi:YVTN family beta-propeller protein